MNFAILLYNLLPAVYPTPRFGNSFSILKSEIHTDNVYLKVSPYLTGKTLSLRYKAQPVNAV
jgi:hypothetical protein